MLLHPGFQEQQDGQGSVAKVAPLYVLSTQSSVEIDSLDPVVFLEGSVDVLSPTSLRISGVITGSFNWVVGVAIYVDDIPINVPSAPNDCHPDCLYVHFDGHNNNGYSQHKPFDTLSDILPVGIHTVKIGMLGKFQGTKHTIYANGNGQTGNFPGSSSLFVTGF